MKRTLIAALIASTMLMMVACQGKVNEVQNKQDTQDVEVTEVSQENTDTVLNDNKDVEAETEAAVAEEIETENIETDVELPPNMAVLADISEYTNLPASEGFEFESNGDGTCTLVKIGECEDETIVIPDKSPDGDIVTKIGEYAFYDVKEKISIVFANRTMELDDKAFQSCEFQKLIIIESDLVIGKQAFEYCDDILEVIISDSKVVVGEYAFYDSGKEMQVLMNESAVTLDSKVFQSSEINVLSINACEAEIGENSFEYCEDLAYVNISDSSVVVEKYAFYDSGSDMKVGFYNSEIELKEKAFQSSKTVSMESFGGNLIIGDNAYEYCGDLESVIIGEGNVEVGEYAFYDCEDLTVLSIAENSVSPDNKVKIEDKAFQSCGVSVVIIGNGEIEIGDRAFEYCENLEFVEIGEGSLTVGEYAFYGCPDTLEIMVSGTKYDKVSIEEIN